jgi:hypothetical protein
MRSAARIGLGVLLGLVLGSLPLLHFRHAAAHHAAAPGGFHATHTH